MLFEPLIWMQGERPIARAVGSDGQPIWVTETWRTRRLRTGILDIQTIQDKRRPDVMCSLPYRLAQTSLALTEVRRFLMLGLGGGAFLHSVRRAFPHAELVAVDKEPRMLDLARRYFETPGHLVVDDGGQFVQRQAPPFDLVFLDAFNGTQAGISGADFFAQAARLLKEDGLVCLNSVYHGPLDVRHRKLAADFRRAFRYVATVRCFPLVTPVNVVFFGTNSAGVAAKDPRKEAQRMVREGRLPAWAVRLAGRIRWREVKRK